MFVCLTNGSYSTELACIFCDMFQGLEQYQASMSDMDTKLDETKAALHRKDLENEVS